MAKNKLTYVFTQKIKGKGTQTAFAIGYKKMMDLTRFINNRCNYLHLLCPKLHLFMKIKGYTFSVKKK